MTINKITLLITCSILVSSCQIQEELIVSFDFYDIYGTMNHELKDKLLSKPPVAVITYKSIIPIPKISASIEKCGFFGLPCLKNNFQDIKTQGIIDPITHKIQFSVPTIYHLNNKFYYFKDNPVDDTKSTEPNIIIGPYDSQNRYTTLQNPIQIGNEFEGFNGTISVNMPGYLQTSSSINVLRTPKSPIYDFVKNHTYAGYMTNNNIQHLPNYKEVDFIDKFKNTIKDIDTVYQAKLYTADLNNNLFENLIIRAKLKDDTNCQTYPNYNYNLFFINQELVSFESQKTDLINCKTDYVSLKKFNNGSIQSYSHDIYDKKINKMFYQEWSYHCPIQKLSGLGQCKLKHPTQQQIGKLEEEAYDLKKIFKS